MGAERHSRAGERDDVRSRFSLGEGSARLKVRGQLVGQNENGRHSDPRSNRNRESKPSGQHAPATLHFI